MKKEQAPLIQQSIAWHLWMPRTLNDTSQAWSQLLQLFHIFRGKNMCFVSVA